MLVKVSMLSLLQSLETLFEEWEASTKDVHHKVETNVMEDTVAKCEKADLTVIY